MKSLFIALIFLIPFTFQSNLTLSNSAIKSTSESYVIPAEDCTYWITKSSHKRHNNKCRWYKNSKGYCTEDKEKGIACKVCGG